mmetsp:Transcript_18038/g.64138  ORF Transcript_18038/g.64138 Transcript_18038/m.64138 type:complete len:230 (+) Transcript_18038:518-1207(+)
MSRSCACCCPWTSTTFYARSRSARRPPTASRSRRCSEPESRRNSSWSAWSTAGCRQSPSSSRRWTPGRSGRRGWSPCASTASRFCKRSGIGTGLTSLRVGLLWRRPATSSTSCADSQTTTPSQSTPPAAAASTIPAKSTPTATWTFWTLLYASSRSRPASSPLWTCACSPRTSRRSASPSSATEARRRRSVRKPPCASSTAIRSRPGANHLSTRTAQRPSCTTCPSPPL